MSHLDPVITINLVKDAKDSERMITFGAKSCYNPEFPRWDGTIMDIENRLWKTGHHTTLQHAPCTYTFTIEGIAVGDVTFGLHLAHPFYNSSQRSGRFCGAMFKNPDFDQMRAYIGQFWAGISLELEEKIIEYIRFGYDVYQENIEKAAELAKTLIKQERPNANEKYVELNAPKIAQEQLRMFIPVVFPTALNYTVNLSALAAMYRIAWSPVLKAITQQMADLILRDCPDLKYAFQRDERHQDILELMLPSNGRKSEIKHKPQLGIITFEESPDSPYLPEPIDLYPVDLAHFNPFLMEGNISTVKTEVEISVATMGQDQRHRTIGRSFPKFTGDFYLPPIPSMLKLDEKAIEMMGKWKELYRCKNLSGSLVCIIAPYGAIVRYRKNAKFNAAIHELSKRLCWTAQEEIYHLARDLRKALIEKTDESHPLVKIMSPACVSTGRCGEGARCCGRNLVDLNRNPFPERNV